MQSPHAAANTSRVIHTRMRLTSPLHRFSSIARRVGVAIHCNRGRTNATVTFQQYSAAAARTMERDGAQIDHAEGSSASRTRPKGRGGRDRAPDDPKTAISKRLAYMLRHGAADHGLSLRPDGFATLSDVLALSSFRGVTEAQIDEIVASCPKKRYSTTVDAAGIKWIRANQGHSLKDAIDADLLCTPVLSAEEAPIAIHGTYFSHWPAIQESGLKCMSRQHVHFAAGEIGASGVISGLRSSAAVHMYLDVAKALANGMKILKSSNNVILTSGFDGVIPMEYFSKVISVKDGKQLWPPAMSG